MTRRYDVFMKSEEFGVEFFPRDSLAEALATIELLYLDPACLTDGVERSIGIRVNHPAEQYENHACPDCGEDIPPEASFGEACDNCGHAFIWVNSYTKPSEIDPNLTEPSEDEDEDG